MTNNGNGLVKIERPFPVDVIARQPDLFTHVVGIFPVFPQTTGVNSVEEAKALIKKRINILCTAEKALRAALLDGAPDPTDVETQYREVFDAVENNHRTVVNENGEPEEVIITSWDVPFGDGCLFFMGYKVWDVI